MPLGRELTTAPHPCLLSKKARTNVERGVGGWETRRESALSCVSSEVIASGTLLGPWEFLDSSYLDLIRPGRGLPDLPAARSR